MALPSFGQIAYVTDGSGQDILAVASDGTVTKVASLSKKLGPPLQVRVGGDNLLYVITPTNILRMTTSGGNLQTVYGATKNGPSGFTGIRFDSRGNLYANTAAGLYVILGVVQAAPANSFNSPSLVTAMSCSPAGDLAFTAGGDALIACNSSSPAGAVFRCAAASLPSSCSPTVVPNISGPVTGLAVDSLGEIVTSTGSDVNIIGNSSTSVDFGSDVPAYLEAVPDQVGGSCDTASPSILVSTAIAGKNGKVWSLDTVMPSNPPNATSPCQAVLPLVKPAAPVALLTSTVPAVGLAAPATMHILTKLATNAAPTDDFNYGATSLELSPLNNGVSNVSNGGCNVVITKEQLSLPYIAGRLANNDAALPAAAITLTGEQSWITGYHGAYPEGCLNNDNAVTHIGFSGVYGYINPHIVLIPDDTSLAAHVDELPFIYPIAPLQGVPGDPIVHNNGSFTTTPQTIIVANIGFTNNAPAGGYLFCGFLPPFVDPPTNKKGINTVNSGQSATFKFQLGTTSCSKLVDDTTAQNIHTGFSIAQDADPNGNPVFVVQNGDGKGNSVSPPTFKYDATGHQFIYTLDTTGYCNGFYEATANGDIFQPHELTIQVIGGGC